MLEHWQAVSLRDELDAIKKRLEELRQVSLNFAVLQGDHTKRIAALEAGQRREEPGLAMRRIEELSLERDNFARQTNEILTYTAKLVKAARRELAACSHRDECGCAFINEEALRSVLAEVPPEVAAMIGDQIGGSK